MNTYDQLALSTMPSFYLASPTVADQSATGLFTITNNGVSNIGQSIIVGHKNSFRISNSETIDISGNLGFLESKTSIEMVIRVVKPVNEIPVIYDVDNQSGLYITPDGIYLKIKFQQDENVQLVQVGKLLKKWDVKLYVRLIFSDSRVDLFVNDDAFSIDYDGTPFEVSNVSMGISSADNDWFLIDGLGSYSIALEDKKDYIDDKNGGYRDVSHRIYNSVSTFFTTADIAFTQKLSNSYFDNRVNESKHYVYNIPNNDDGYQYFIVKNSNESLSFAYKIETDDNWTLFVKDFVIPATADSIAFALSVSNFDQITEEDFELEISGVSNADIYEDSPAILTLTGYAFYPDSVQDSITNNPQGMTLYESRFDGVWQSNINGDSAFKTIEMVFKAHDLTQKTFLYNSADNSASFGPAGSISNFTAYLNGDMVTDLDDIIENQWYHLVLVSETVLSDEFSLNYDGTESQTLSYLFFSAYEYELTQANAQNLFSLLNGSDAISFEETTSVIEEGLTDNGTAYKAYAYTWAIIGAGGH